MKIDTNEYGWYWSDLWEEVVIRNPVTGGTYKGEFMACDYEWILDGCGGEEEIPVDIRFVSKDVEFKLDELEDWEHESQM